MDLSNKVYINDINLLVKEKCKGTPRKTLGALSNEDGDANKYGKEQ